MTELEKFQAVNETKSITQLQEVIRSFADANGQIQGRSKQFPASWMADNAMFYFNGTAPESNLTRMYGIRQQAMYLKYYNKR